LVRVEIVLFWAGLALLAVGVSIVVLEAQAIRSGIAAEGRIAGYAERPGNSGAMYYAVVAFVDLKGRRRLIESRIGSGVPIGRVGDRVKVVQQAGEPDRASVASRLTSVIGVVVALMGAVCCGLFLATFRVELYSVAASVVVSAIVGVKLHALRARIGDKLPSWRAIRDQAIRMGAPLLVAAGVAIVCLAVHLQKTTSEFLAHAVTATGRVVGLAPNSSSDGTTYAAMVEFEADGSLHRFKDAVSSNPPSFRAGDEVPIRYLPDNPDMARIDRGIWSRLMPPAVGLFGALLVLAGWSLGARALRATRTDDSAPMDNTAAAA
jgi:hypothetical protein